jgi:hypothetical protein
MKPYLTMIIVIALGGKPAMSQVTGDWPASSSYTYFGTNGLSQSSQANYAVLQDKATGTTYLNSPSVIYFRIGNQTTMFLSNAGYFGIGTTSPAQSLHTTGNFRIQGTNSTIPHGYMEFYRYDGTKFASIGQGVPGLLNSTFDIQHYNGNDIRFLNMNSEQMRITSDGNVGIGTSTPDQKLTVNGTVHATRVKVETTVPGPDYVFEKDYSLPTLEEIKFYIAENRHLPDVPSAKEMEVKGIDVGEMNMLLIKKVEELTLYLIQQQTELTLLRKEISNIVGKNNSTTNFKN